MPTTLEEFIEYVNAQIALGREWIKNLVSVGNRQIVYYERKETLLAFDVKTGNMVRFI